MLILLASMPEKLHWLRLTTSSYALQKRQAWAFWHPSITGAVTTPLSIACAEHTASEIAVHGLAAVTQPPAARSLLSSSAILLRAKASLKVRFLVLSQSPAALIAYPSAPPAPSTDRTSAARSLPTSLSIENSARSEKSASPPHPRQARSPLCQAHRETTATTKNRVGQCAMPIGVNIRCRLTPNHADGDLLPLKNAREPGAGELASLVPAEDLGFSEARQHCLHASAQKSIVSGIDARRASTHLPNRSTMAAE